MMMNDFCLINCLFPCQKCLSTWFGGAPLRNSDHEDNHVTQSYCRLIIPTSSSDCVVQGLQLQLKCKILGGEISLQPCLRLYSLQINQKGTKSCISFPKALCNMALIGFQKQSRIFFCSQALISDCFTEIELVYSCVVCVDQSFSSFGGLEAPDDLGKISPSTPQQFPGHRCG